MKEKKSLPLFWRLLVLIMAVWFILLSVTMMVTLRYALQTFQTKIDEILVSTVVTLGDCPPVYNMLRTGVCSADMAKYLDAVIENTDDLEYITIADENSIRVYHVNAEMIGQPFEGGDQYRALAGERYLSDATPANFEGQRRAFEPVFDEDGQVMGFVMASATHQRINDLRSRILATYARLALLLTACTLLFSGGLAMYLGRNLRGVKPEDLIRMYLTQNDMLNALDEGVMSFDKTGRVRLVNAAAARMLGHREDLLVGQQVDDLLRDEDGNSLRNRGSQGLQSNHANILVKPVQLPDANLWARQVLILADKTEIARYAEELGGTRHMINTLRANNHEFMNKLQVISGLLQMGRVDDAQGYIGQIAAVHEQIMGPVLKLIRNTSVAALILGKEINMRERDIFFVLMNNSCLPERSRYLSTDELVTVVGNLLENALEATDIVPLESLRGVALQITEDEKGLLIMVSDSGEGISESVLPRIFETGFSTKAASGRGVGMNHIKEIVDRHGGSIEVDTDPGSGTTFTLIFSRERGGYA